MMEYQVIFQNRRIADEKKISIIHQTHDFIQSHSLSVIVFKKVFINQTTFDVTFICIEIISQKRRVNIFTKLIMIFDINDNEVYDAHEAFEIDKTKMKMLVPLDMNGKQLMNVNYDLKFGDIVKVIKCDTRYSSNRQYFIVVRKDNHQILSYSSPVIVNSVTSHNKQTFHNNASMRFITGGQSTDREFKLGTLISGNLISNLTPWLDLNSGFRSVRLKNLVNNFSIPFDIDFIISYM